MGKDKNKEKASEQLGQVGSSAQQWYQQLMSNQTPLEQEIIPQTQTLWNAYNAARQRQEEDYGNIMGGYKDYLKNLPSPTRFGYQTVRAERPAELGESYGYLREAAPGYREFASTGGYSPTDIQELRERGISPIRSAYSNAMMELNRARALGGAGGAPNYMAALASVERALPGQIADAMTTVNAQLADAIRQGKLAGLAGLTNIGGTMGGLSSAEAGRILQAALANQAADLQAQELSERSLQSSIANQLAGLHGMTGLYGTTPAMASSFGNMALQGIQSRLGLEGLRNQLGLNLLNTQLGAATGLPTGGTPWWQTALGVAGTVAPYIAMAASSRELKEDIKPVKSTSRLVKALKELPLYTWKYKGDNVRHIGPIAEEFQEKFGIGDGKTLHLADIMGVMLAAGKEAASHA